MDLQDRNGELKIIGIKNAETRDITKWATGKSCYPSTDPYESPHEVCVDAGNICDVQISLYVDEVTGRIWVNKVDKPYCDPDTKRLNLI